MSISVTLLFSRMRARTGVPPSLDVFRFNGGITGDASGGTVTFVTPFNVDLRTRPESFCITTWRVVAATGITDGCRCGIAASDWIEPPVDFIGGVFIDAGSRSVFQAVTPDNPYNLGQVTPGTDGTCTAVLETNTDLAVYVTDIRGFWAQRPFVVPTTIAL